MTVEANKIALLIEYTGKKFHGSQYQEGVLTVQQELERALAILFGQPLRAIFSGRTDSGVNARGQVVHVVLPEGRQALSRSEIFDLTWRLNGIIIKEMSVTALDNAPSDFHARFSASEREYVYRILNRSQRSALLKDTHYFVRQPLDLKAMRSAASSLLGRHDFASFKSSNSDNSSTICTVRRAELLNLREGELEFWIAADHFVYNMVRIIVGTLIDIGLGKRGVEAVEQALASHDRLLTGPTAPPWGLTLNAVRYPDHFQLFQNDTGLTIEELRE